MTITLKSKVDLRIIVRSYHYKKLKVILENNNMQFLTYNDDNLGVRVVTVLEISVSKIPVLTKLMRDESLEDLS